MTTLSPELNARLMKIESALDILGDPARITLNGTDESIEIPDLFKDRVTGDVADAFSWGISARLPDVSTGPLVGASGGGPLDCTASMTIVSGSIRSWAQSSATKVRRQRTASTVLTADTDFRVASTWAGVANGAPTIYVDAVDESANVGDSDCSPDASTSVSIGRDGELHRRAGQFWAFWWTPVEMTGAQVSELDALIVARDYKGAREYLRVISPDSVIKPVLSTGNVCQGLADLLGNKGTVLVGVDERNRENEKRDQEHNCDPDIDSDGGEP